MAAGKTGSQSWTGSRGGFYVRVNWSEDYDVTTHTSTVTITSVDIKGTSWYGFIFYPSGKVLVNGTAVITMNSVQGTHNVTNNNMTDWYSIKASGGAVATGKLTGIPHDADGKASIKISFSNSDGDKLGFYRTSYDSGPKAWTVTDAGTTSHDLTQLTTYALTISAGTGSSITVNRTYSNCSGVTIGNLSSGAKLYYNDKIKVTYTPNTNYKVTSSKLNNADFVNNNTHIVTGNVTVSSTAQPLASDVGAADANIGSVATITVTKYGTGYYHTLQYSFGSLSGYINASGAAVSSATKINAVSVPFTVPTTFYAQIPNNPSGKCTITCRTYANASSTTQLGDATTCTFTATAAEASCKPTLSVSVVDTNATTKALTGDASKLIRYRSDAACTITATPRNSASVTKLTINGTEVTKTASGSSVVGTKTYTDVQVTSFAFGATDSRSYTSTQTVTPSMVAYIQLSCNPVLYRPTPTGDVIKMDVSGDWYRGSFGALSNTLTLQYRYKESGGSYGEWQTVPSTSIVTGTKTYASDGSITMEGSFDYRKDYIFQIKATDGNGAYELSRVTKDVQVNRGIPVFDWGENDFNVNAEFRLGNINIIDVFYPVGSVYMGSSSTIPGTINSMGTWVSITSGISGVYAWKRTA